MRAAGVAPGSGRVGVREPVHDPRLRGAAGSDRRRNHNVPIASEPKSQSWRDRLNRALDWIEPHKNPTGVVYGTLLIGAVLATESFRRETLLRTVAATALTLLVYWMAHSYAEMLGDRLERHGRLSVGGFRRSLARDWAIVRGGFVPVLALLIVSAAGASLYNAVAVAVWTSAITIFLLELVAGIRAELNGTELAVQVCAGAIMGATIIVLRALLH
jgi:hypothetical protein